MPGTESRCCPVWFLPDGNQRVEKENKGEEEVLEKRGVHIRSVFILPVK